MMRDNFLNYLKPHWLQFQNQLQSNQRLRWMVWGIAYIFVLYFALSLSEWRGEHNETIARLQKTSFKLDLLQHQTQWPERWQQEKNIAEKLRAKLWEAPSEGLAEADAQNYLRQLMLNHSVQNYRPRLAASERVDIAGVTLIKVSAEVLGVIAPQQIDHLMKTIADNQKAVILERFSYNAQANGQLTIQFSIYFLVTEPPIATTEPNGDQHVDR